jgi:hypothetical protein
LFAGSLKSGERKTPRIFVFEQRLLRGHYNKQAAAEAIVTVFPQHQVAERRALY